MAKYKVEMIVSGTATVEVEAENAQNAKDAAFDAVDRLSFGSLSKIRTNISCVEDDNHRDVTLVRNFVPYVSSHKFYNHYTNKEEAF